MRSEFEDKLLEIERKNDDPLRIVLRALSKLLNLSFALVKKINQVVHPILLLIHPIFFLVHPILLLAVAFGDMATAIFSSFAAWFVITYTKKLCLSSEETKSPDSQ